MSTKINPWLLRQAGPSPSSTAQDGLGSPSWSDPTTASANQAASVSKRLAPVPDDSALLPEDSVPLPEDPVRPSGPAAPQRGGRVPEPLRRLPIDQRPADLASLRVVGVHGGAGESTIAALRTDWAAGNHGLPPASLGPARILLTCRSHISGLLAAQAAATQWAGGGFGRLELVGLLIIADAPGQTPKPVRDLIPVVAGGVPRCWRLPWCEAWRLGESPPIAQLPRAFGRLFAEIDKLTADSNHPDPVTLEGIHHASPRDAHPARHPLGLAHPATDPR